MDWYWIPLIWLLAGVVSFGLASLAKKAENDGIGSGMFPDNSDQKSAKHWTEDMTDPEEQPKRHWTEYLDNSDEAEDRDDNWEWERQDDFGDSWDHEEN